MALKKQLQDLDFLSVSKLIGALIDPVSSDPGSPVTSQLWYNTTSKRMKAYDGTAVQTLLTLEGNDTITGVFTYNPGAGSVPFSVHSSKTGTVTNLNADLLDGYHGSAAATANTYGLRQSDGTLVVATPVNANEAANKAYVDSAIENRDQKQECWVATTGNVNLASMPAVVDGETLPTGKRFLAKDQDSAAENGLYVFNGAGAAATRATDADEDEEVTSGLTTYIVYGSTHAGAIFTLTTGNPITVDTTALTFTQTGGQSVFDAGNGMVKANSKFHFIQSTNYGVGDLVYSSSPTQMAFLTLGAAGTVLKGGVSAPSFGALDLTADVGSSILPVANGGTGTSTAAASGRLIIAGTSGVHSSDADLFWSFANDRLGIGTTSPAARLNVVNGASGGTAHTSADEVVIENNANAGLSVLVPDTYQAQVRLGSASNDSVALWTAQHNIELVQFGTGIVDGKLQLLSGFGEVAMTINADQSVSIGTTSSPGGSNKLWIYDFSGAASMLIGAGQANGATLILDGAANGDGAGADYANITHEAAGDLSISNSGNFNIDFVTNSQNVGAFKPGGVLSVGRHGGTWPLDVYSATTPSMFRLLAAQNGNQGPIQRFEHDSTSPAAADTIGEIEFVSTDAADAQVESAHLRVTVAEVGTGFVDSDIIFRVFESGAANDLLTLTHDGRVAVGGTAPTRGIFEVHNAETGNTPPVFITATSTGDASATFNISGVTNWTLGIDNSDSDKFKLGAYSALGTGSAISITTGGNVGIFTESPTSTLDVTGTFALSGAAAIGTGNEDDHTFLGNILLGGDDGAPTGIGTGGMLQTKGRSGSTTIPIAQFNKVGDSGSVLECQVNGTSFARLSDATSFINSSLLVNTTTSTGKTFSVAGSAIITNSGANTTFDSGAATDARTEFHTNSVREGYISWNADVLNLVGDTGSVVKIYSGANTNQIYCGTDGNVGILNGSPTEALDVTGNIKLSGALKLGGALSLPNKWKTQTVALTAPGTSGNAGSWYIRLQPVSTSAIVSGRITLTGTWDSANFTGQLVAEFGYFCNGTALDSSVNYLRIVSATGVVGNNGRILSLVEENGYVSIPIWAANKIGAQVKIEYWESSTGALDSISQTAFATGTLPSYVMPSTAGLLVDSNNIVVRRTDSTVYTGTAPLEEDCFLSISNTGASEAANLQAQIQFTVDGGTYERRGSFGMIANSASTRLSSFVWTLDDASTRPEFMRLNTTGLGIGQSSISYRLDVREDSATDLLLARFCNADAAGGSMIQIDRTGNHRTASIQLSTEGTPDWYVGMLRWGGSTTARFAVSSVSDIATAEPEFCISGSYVGIGDANPSMRLNVKGSSNTTSSIGLENTATDNKWRLHAHYADQSLRFRADTFTTDIFSLTDTGRARLGEGAPTYTFEIQGSTADAAATVLLLTGNTSYNAQLKLYSSGGATAADKWTVEARATTTRRFSISEDTTEHFTILSGGFTGIGTTTPDTVFHVVGNSGLKLSSTSESTNNIFYPGSLGLEIRTGAGTSVLAFNNSSLDVGIGTTSPGGRLHVVGGTTSGDTLLKLGNRIKVTGAGALLFGSAAAHGQLTYDTGKAILGSIGSNDLVLMTGSNTRMVIDDANGAVGIGPSAGLYQLEVAASTSFVSTGSCKINAGLSGSGVGLFVDANSRSSADDAISVLSIRDRTGAYPLTVSVAGKVNLSKLTASYVLCLDGNKDIVSPFATTELCRFKTGTIGNGSSTELTFTHNLGTRNVIVQVFEEASPYEEIDVQIARTTINTVTIKTNQAPATDAWRVVATAQNV